MTPDPIQESFAPDHPLLVSVSESGLCRLVCFSPRHDLTLFELELPVIENIITTWAQQTAELSTKDFIQNVQVFENKGAIMGFQSASAQSDLGSIPITQ